MDNLVEFASRMKIQREKLGMTQAQLGEKIGVSAQTISAYEKNVFSGKGKAPTLDKVISLSKVLGVSIDNLCGMETCAKGCEMESLRDIVECLFRISRYIQCYGGTKKRGLTEEEAMEQSGLPDELQETFVPMAVFTLDNRILAKFFDTKKKLSPLRNDGTLTKELYDTIIEGQLANLERFKIQENGYLYSLDDDTEVYHE